jgi:site-specific DNA-methyltransferase (adenine-specific)
MTFNDTLISKIQKIFDDNYKNDLEELFTFDSIQVRKINDKTVRVADKFDITYAEAKKIVDFNQEKIEVFFSIINDKEHGDEDYTSLTSLIKETEKVDEFATRRKNINHAYPNLQLFQGDCRESLKKIEDSVVDLVVTDPPFGIDFVSSRNKDTWKETETPEYYFQLLDDVCKELIRICKQDAHIYVFTGWKGIAEFKITLEKYFDISNIIVWAKNNHSLVDFSKKYAPSYENAFFCKMKGNKDRSLTNNLSKDVLMFNRVHNPFHSCEKPVKLLEYFIKNSSVEGEVILDPFMGSGSCGVATIKNNRKYIGCEIEEKYFNHSKIRIENLLKKKGI